MEGMMRRIGGMLEKLAPRRSLGIALGGGGVRGLAHIGVLSVLDREGIAVDALAGTSMGSIVATAYAMSDRFNEEELVGLVSSLGIAPPVAAKLSDADCHSLMERVRRLVDVERFLIDTMWGWGVFEGAVVGDALSKVSGGKRIEDSRIPLAVVATDLITGEKVVFRHGPVALAVQASSALPGFFPPVRHEGRLLVDGAFVDLVPVDVVLQMGARIGMAVDVDQDRADTDVTNGLQAFLRAVDIGARQHKAYQLQTADLVIRPDFGEPVSSLDFSKARLCVEAGRKAMEDSVPELRRLLNRARPDVQ
jgi:NTE family protein